MKIYVPNLHIISNIKRLNGTTIIKFSFFYYFISSWGKYFYTICYFYYIKFSAKATNICCMLFCNCPLRLWKWMLWHFIGEWERKHLFLKLNSLIKFFRIQKPLSCLRNYQKKGNTPFWFILTHFKTKNYIFVVVASIK